MPIDALTAANAYSNQLKLMKDAATSPEQDASQPSFSQMVKDAAQEAASSLQKSETHQIQSLTDGGKVDHLSDMVTAVANAELTLNTVVAVRDRVIGAYNDIIKMSI